MKKTTLIVSGISIIFFLLGCGERQYAENQFYGKGLNAHINFDTIEKDRFLVAQIQKYNKDYFEQHRNKAFNKMYEILKTPVPYATKTKKTQSNKDKDAADVGYRIDLPENSALDDVSKDFRYGL